MEEQQMQQEQQEQAQERQPRDFEQELRELLTARPELRGEELPQEVVEASVRGKSVTEAYNDYAREQRKQRPRPAAPVRGVTRGGSVQQPPEDAFLKGLRTEW